MKQSDELEDVRDALGHVLFYLIWGKNKFLSQLVLLYTDETCLVVLELGICTHKAIQRGLFQQP